MTRWIKRITLALLAAAVLPLGGCQLTYFTISIPDFGTKSVSGVWLWRLSPTTGLYERDTQFVFDDGTVAEQLDYRAASADGVTAFDVTTFIVRDPVNPDHLTLQLLYSRTEAPGYYRASTYNAVGDSPLSTEIVPL